MNNKELLTDFMTFIKDNTTSTKWVNTTKIIELYLNKDKEQTPVLEYGYYYVDVLDSNEKTIAEFSKYGWSIIGSDDVFNQKDFYILSKIN
jgi:hypothetical protein